MKARSEEGRGGWGGGGVGCGGMERRDDEDANGSEKITNILNDKKQSKEIGCPLSKYISRAPTNLASSSPTGSVEGTG